MKKKIKQIIKIINNLNKLFPQKQQAGKNI